MTAGERATSTCGQITPLLPELSLGVLGGRDRELALRHLSRCAVCSLELEQLSTVADGLLTLAAPCDAPAAFELSVRHRLQAEDQRLPRVAGEAGGGTDDVHRGTRHRSVRRLLGSRPAMAVSAATLALLVAFGGGWLLRSHRAASGGYRGPGSPVIRPATASATLLADGHPVGRLLLFGGRPDWLMVSVHHLAGEPAVRCTVTTTGGKTLTLGTFSLSGGSGTWSAPLRVNSAAVATATLFDTRGRVVAAAWVDQRAGEGPTKRGPSAARNRLGTQ
jgi:hypothetical protein